MCLREASKHLLPQKEDKKTHNWNFYSIASKVLSSIYCQLVKLALPIFIRLDHFNNPECLILNVAA